MVSEARSGPRGHHVDVHLEYLLRDRLTRTRYRWLHHTHPAIPFLWGRGRPCLHTLSLPAGRGRRHPRDERDRRHVKNPDSSQRPQPLRPFFRYRIVVSTYRSAHYRPQDDLSAGGSRENSVITVHECFRTRDDQSDRRGHHADGTLEL